MEEQVPDWAQESAVPDWAKEDSSDTSIAPKTPETDKAIWEQIRDFAKTPSPAWMQPYEQAIRKVATTAPQIPESPGASGPMKMMTSTVNPLLGFATLENAALGAAWAVQPEIGAALTAAKIAPGVAPWWEKAKRLPQMTPEEGLKFGWETWPMVTLPFTHAIGKAVDTAYPEPPTLPRGGVGTFTKPSTLEGLTPVEYVRKYQQAPEDLTGIPDQPQAETPPVASQEVPGSPGFARFQGEVTPQETDESAQARAHALAR